MLTKNHENLTIEVKHHVEADAILQGTYWDGSHGCFIGCLAHSNDATKLGELYGLPLSLVRIFENIFEYRGRPEHEIIFAYSASFSDAALYHRDRFEGVESNHVPFVAEWVSLESFSGPEKVLFPEGLLRLLRGEA